jgi:hypothetical protein
MLRFCICIGCAAVALVPVAGGGQLAQTRLSVNAGTATDVSGLSSRAVTVSPTVTFTPSANEALTISAAGTRFGTGAWSALGAAGVSGRRSAGRVATTFDGSASYTSTSYHLSYASADAMPALEIGFGPVQAFVGGHASFASLSTSTPGTVAPFGALPGSESGGTTRVSRSGISAMAGVGTRVVTDDGTTITGAVREERGTVAGSSQIDRTATVGVSRDRIAIAAGLGTRRRGSERSAFGSGSLSVGISDGFALTAGGGRYAANPLTGAAAGSYATLGASVRLGRSAGSRVPSLPKAYGVGAPPPGVTRLSINAASATRVELAGDFTKWQFVDARRTPNGVWYVDLRIPPGEYRYAFRIDGRAWRVPDGIPAATDDFGGNSAWLVVQPPASRARQ